MSFVKKKGIKEDLVTKYDSQDIANKKITNSNISNSNLSNVNIENCVISNIKNNIILSFENLDLARNSEDIIKVGEIIYIKSDKKLYQVDLENNKKVFIELLKKRPSVILKLTDNSGQFLYKNKDNNLLFNKIVHDNEYLTLKDNRIIKVDKNGFYSIKIKFVLNNVKNIDILNKFAIKVNKEEEVDITDFIIKDNNIAYLSGEFEGILNRNDTIELILNIKSDHDKYASIKNGVNYLTMRLLEEL